MAEPDRIDTITSGIDAMIARAESAGDTAKAADLREVKQKHLRHLRLMDRIVTAFTPPPGRHRPPDMTNDTERADIGHLATMIEHIRAEIRRSFYYADETHDLREAIRTISRLLPGRIALAERELDEARQRGENSDLGHTIRHLRALEGAVGPLAPWATRKLHRRSAKWHIPARMIALHVSTILGRQGVKAGFANADAPSVEIVRRLLILIRVHVALPTIVETLSVKKAPGKESKRPRVPGPG